MKNKAMIASENVYHTTKENIHLLRFTRKKVTLSEIDRRKRSIALIQAMHLGNIFKNKVSIYFRDSLDRLIRVQTTIWGVTQENIILKKGTLIPIHCIERID